MSRLPRAGFRDHSPRSRGSQDGEPSLVSFQLSGSGAAVASSCLAFWAGGQVLATMSGAGGLFAVNRSRRLGRFAFGFQLAVVSGFLFGEHFTRIPCRFVWHHGPGDHADLTCQGDASFLAPRLATACDTVKRFLTPCVVAETTPLTCTIACTGAGVAAVFKWQTFLSPPGDAGRSPTNVIAPNRNAPMLIDNTAALLAHLESSRMTFQWAIPPEAEHSILLSPSHLRFLVEDTPVASCPLIDSFKRFVCASIGEIKNTSGTKNPATGSLKLSTCTSDRMLDIDYDCTEPPNVEGSCYFGGGLVPVPLTEFLLAHEL